MTKRQATMILLQAARNYVSGAGQGLADHPSEKGKEKIKEAAKKLWGQAYRFPMPEHWPL